MIHVIRKILVDDSNLTALVPASRISLVMARQGMQRPYIAVDLEGTEVNRYGHRPRDIQHHGVHHRHQDQ